MAKPLPYLMLSKVDEQGNFEKLSFKTISAARKAIRQLGGGLIIQRDSIKPSLAVPGTWDCTYVVAEVV